MPSSAEKFARRLIGLYEEGFYGPKIHRKLRAPKNARTKKQKLLYYFYVLSVDYGMKAKPLFRRMRALHEESPEWFDPEFLRKVGNEKLIRKMKGLKMRFPSQAAKRWKTNSMKLLDWNDKIGDVFKGTADEMLRNISSFYGFGPKLSRLLLRVVVDERLIKQPEGFEEMELPTDVHVAKIAIRAGLVKGDLKNYSRIVPEARKKWTELSRKLVILPADLDRALWVLGAEWCSKKKCGKCPLREFCLLPSDIS